MTQPTNDSVELDEKLKALNTEKYIERILLDLWYADPKAYSMATFQKALQEILLKTQSDAQTLINKRVNEARIDELENILMLGRQTADTQAHISDIAIANNIRVHTNALVQHRLAHLQSNTSKGDSENE